MAALSKNGFEVARLERTIIVDTATRTTQTVIYSFRSNGWVLKRSRASDGGTSGWKRWARIQSITGRGPKQLDGLLPKETEERRKHDEVVSLVSEAAYRMCRRTPGIRALSGIVWDGA